MNLDPNTDSTNYAVDYRSAFPEVLILFEFPAKMEQIIDFLQYLNDLDNDKQYKEWGNSVKLMIQPYFPGMIRPIARNFFTLVSIFCLKSFVSK